MAIPPNITSATAISLVNPTSITQDVRDNDTGIVYTVWYKYTETVQDRVIDFKFYGVIGGSVSDYRPIAYVYTDPTGSAFTSTIVNCQGQLPIALGQTYYFQIFRNNAGLLVATLNIEFLYAPDIATVPAGSVYIRAASISSTLVSFGFTGLPGGFIDAATDSIIDYIPFFSCGESGDVLPSTGRMLFFDEFGSIAPFPPTGHTAYLYNSNFTLVTSFTFDTRGGNPLIRTHNPSNKFYILSVGSSAAPATPVTFRTVDANGNLGTSQPMTAGTYGCTGFAINTAETILYISGVSSSNNSNVKRWDIINAVFLSDLSATVANHRVTDILVMSDDSIVVMYFKSTVTRDVYVVRYDSAGATLNTYTFTHAQPETSIEPRLGYSANSPEAFWVFFHTSSGLDGWSDIRKIRLSDGVELVSSLTRDSGFEFYEASGPPYALTSDSCPIIEIRAAIGPPPPTTYYPGIYIIVPGKTDDTVKNGGSTLDLKIPNPTFKTGLLG